VPGSRRKDIPCEKQGPKKKRQPYLSMMIVEDGKGVKLPTL
jgi:hypothetical protein